jgi:predicted nicotinamide N-methyase
MAEEAIAWLRPLARAGRKVLLADPGRAYLPKTGLTALASYDVAVPLDLEDREVRRTTVYRLEP